MADPEKALRGFGDTAQSSDGGEEDLDVIEMTPTERTDMAKQEFRMSDHSHVSRSEDTDERSFGQQGKDHVRASNHRGHEIEESSEARQRMSEGDPSSQDPAGSIRQAEPGVLVSLVSNISKAFSSGEKETQSPSSVTETETPILLKREGPSVVSPLNQDAKDAPRIIGLFDGDDPALKLQLIFKSSNDPAAKDFAAFLKEDGVAPRIPVLCMSDYGIGEFASDLWTLHHNAIKRELFDLYEIIGVIRLRYLSLSFGDFYNLRVWWRLFGVFLIQYLTIEVTLLDPLIKTVVGVDGRGESLRRKVTPLVEMREWVLCKFEEISGYMEEFETLPRGRALSLICRTIDALGFKLLTLFHQQERTLPSMVESYHDETIKKVTELKVIEFLRTSDFFPEAIVHQTRWMEAGKVRDQWLTNHLRWSEKANVARFYRRYEMNHGKFVLAFRGKLRA
jgi:hypothetical protein